MRCVLSEPYAEMYKKYTAYAQSRFSCASYQNRKNLLRQILQWFEKEEILPEKVGISEVQRFKENISETVNRRGEVYSSVTIRNLLKAGREVWEYLVKEGVVPSNPFQSVSYPRIVEIKKDTGIVLSSPYAEIYESYKAYVRRRINKPGEIKQRSLCLQILQWFDREDILPEEVSISDVVKYKQSISETVSRRGTVYSSGAICNFLKAGRVMWDYLVKEEKVPSNPFREVPYPRIPQHLTRNFLNESQMNRLLETLTHFENLEEYRAHVVSEFLYATGLRIAEAASLEVGDIDTEQRMVYVREGKGGVSRIAFLTCYAADVMDQYLKKGREVLLEQKWRKNGEKVFGCDKRTLSGSVSETVSEVCKRLEQPEITCHGFRHSLGTHLLKAGCDMRHIQVILGHENLNSTQVYTRVDKDDLRESIDSYHPRKYGRIKEQGDKE